MEVNVILKFDYYSCTIYIPDGYIRDLNEIYDNFFEWLHHQPSCIKRVGKNDVLSYNEKDFLRYINEEVLKGVEKAYIASDIPKSKKKIPILKF